MNRQKRNQCIITGIGEIKKLHTFKNFPISMSAVDGVDCSTDIFDDMERGVSE